MKNLHIALKMANEKENGHSIAFAMAMKKLKIFTLHLRWQMKRKCSQHCIHHSSNNFLAATTFSSKWGNENSNLYFWPSTKFYTVYLYFWPSTKFYTEYLYFWPSNKLYTVYYRILYTSDHLPNYTSCTAHIIHIGPHNTHHASEKFILLSFSTIHIHCYLGHTLLCLS